MTKRKSPPAPGATTPAEMTRDPTRRTGPLRDLVTMRMIILFGLLRRSGVLAQRRHFDLSELEWRVMTQVAEFAPLSLNGLVDLLLQDRGQLSRTVKGLVARGLLTRERKPGGPEIVIELSAAGSALYARMIERAIERDRALTAGIPAEDLRTLWRVTDRMIERARDLMEEERKLEAAANAQVIDEVK